MTFEYVYSIGFGDVLAMFDMPDIDVLAMFDMPDIPNDNHDWHINGYDSVSGKPDSLICLKCNTSITVCRSMDPKRSGYWVYNIFYIDALDAKYDNNISCEECLMQNTLE